MPPDETSPAWNLFIRLIGDPTLAGYDESRVQKLVALCANGNPTNESSILDFKVGHIPGGKTPGQPLPASKVADIWGKALSGFANTEGGVLVWGIDAREDKMTGHDIASDVVAVPDVVAFASRLSELQTTITEATVPGVRIVPVQRASDTNEGFVVCYVPSSPWKPHRRQADKEFFLRSTNSFFPAPVALIRNFFVPTRASPTFEIVAKVRDQISHNKGELGVDIKIRNTGLLTAAEVVLRLRSPGLLPYNVRGFSMDEGSKS